MAAHGCQSARSDRPGFTLVEVLLTLCLLVVIASLVWPVLDKPFANQRLRKSADRVRVHWCAARVDAMDTGEVYVFRCAIGGNRYRIDRCAGLMATADALDAEGAKQPAMTGRPAVTKRVLPNGVNFVSAAIEADSRATMLGVGNDLASTASATAANWSEPIIFYPDGTTSTAKLVMKNKHGRKVRLSLHGLTGVVRVSDGSSNEGWIP